MNTIYKMTEKRTYSTPEVLCIKLDNEISLALESNEPDIDPTFTSQNFNNDPFKNGMA